MAIGARDFERLNREQWATDVLASTFSDAASFNYMSAGGENRFNKYKVIEKSEIDWPLQAMSRLYFNVSPTFPGLYSIYNYEKEFPHEVNNQGRSFQGCRK